MSNVIDLSKLLDYYEKLSDAIDLIFPDEITFENAFEYNYNLDYKHPKWVQAYFPLIMIYHKEKAGKLRNSKKLSIMYQNNQNVLTQLVMTADDFGAYHRKNKHKGFKDIVAAVVPEKEYYEGIIYTDKEKPKKFKNFEEFRNLHDPSNLYLKALCEILSENYTCDSVGQLRLI